MEIRGPGGRNLGDCESLLGKFLGGLSSFTPGHTWLPVQKHLPGRGGMGTSESLELTEIGGQMWESGGSPMTLEGTPLRGQRKPGLTRGGSRGPLRANTASVPPGSEGAVPLNYSLQGAQQSRPALPLPTRATLGRPTEAAMLSAAAP